MSEIELRKVKAHRGADGTYSSAVAQPSATWKLLHRGDPCTLCGKPANEVTPGGCPVTAQQLWSRIGRLVDAANAAWEKIGPKGDTTEARREARRLEEEVKRLQQLHEVLTKDMAPAGEGS